MRCTDPKVFLARQPIFDRAQRVVAYELLFRTRDQRCEVRVSYGRPVVMTG